MSEEMEMVENPHVPKRLFMHRVCHVVLTFVMLCLAYYYALDKTTGAVIHGATVYRVMLEIAPIESWGDFALWIAIVGMVTSMSNNFKTRIAGAGVLAAGHAIFATFMLMGSPHATISWLFAGYAGIGTALAYSTAHMGQRDP